MAFFKAANARDVDAAMKVADVPFYSTPKGKDTLFEKTDDLKRWFGDRPADKRFSEQVTEVLSVGDLLKKGKIDPKSDDSDIELARKVLGNDGYVVVLGTKEKPGGVLLVAIRKDGSAKVVGLPPG